MGPDAQSTGRKHTDMPRKENSGSWRWHLKLTSNSSHCWRKRFSWQGEELLSGYQLFTNCTREKDVGEGVREGREKEWPLPQVFMFRVEVVVTPAWPEDLLSIETLPKQRSLESGWERPLKECWCRRLPRWPPHSCRSEVSLPTSLWIPQEANEFSRQNLFLKPVSSGGLKVLVYQTLVILLPRTVYFITLSFIGLWLFGNLLNSLCILRLNTLLAKVVLPPCRPSPRSISGFLYCSEFFEFYAIPCQFLALFLELL